MRVVISLKKLHSASQTRGVGVYTRELIAALSKLYPKDQIIPTSHDPRLVKCDLIHYPYFDPFTRSLIQSKQIPTVVTIHDLIPLRFSAHFPVGLRGKFNWFWQQRAARSTDHILTDSQSSRSDILRLIGVDEARVSVIPLGPNHTQKAPAALVKKIRHAYALPERYLLYVGDINWNKNVVGLIQAFAKLPQSDLALVLVGKVFGDKPNIPEYRAVSEVIRATGLEGRILQLGYVPSHHLSVIYSSATLYVQPSWYEGFGLPILEAMKFGCPVASSDRGSLPEVGGSAVAYFDPAKNMVEVISGLLNNSLRRKELAALGIARAKEFTWEKTAHATHAIYEQVLAQTS